MKSAAAHRAAASELARLESEFARTALDALTEAEANVRLRTEELKKAEDRSALTLLSAPIDGVVQQLQVSTPRAASESGNRFSCPAARVLK